MIALKKGIALALGLVLLAGCGSSQKQETETPKEEKLEKIELSVAKTEINVDEELEITVVTTPKDIEIKTSSFQEMKDAKIEKKDDKYMFKATKAGTYTILAKQDSIDSNTLKVKVNGEETDEEENQTNNETASSQTTSNQQADTDEETTSNEQVIVGADGTPHNDPNWNATDEQVVVGADGRPHNGPSSVDWVLSHVDQYLAPDQKTWVTGTVPQALKEDANGNMSMVLWNDDQTQYLVLEGYTGAGNQEVTLTGTLSKDGNVYVLTV
ncbi:hypothetical protein C815_01779 [Firmicutes bacterium M10-2]|nr:hypothetical protein C815_01779 [Firmicutes bacterium M10-2]